MLLVIKDYMCNVCVGGGSEWLFLCCLNERQMDNILNKVCIKSA